MADKKQKLYHGGFYIVEPLTADKMSDSSGNFIDIRKADFDKFRKSGKMPLYAVPRLPYWSSQLAKQKLKVVAVIEPEQVGDFQKFQEQGGDLRKLDMSPDFSKLLKKTEK